MSCRERARSRAPPSVFMCFENDNLNKYHIKFTKAKQQKLLLISNFVPVRPCSMLPSLFPSPSFALARSLLNGIAKSFYFTFFSALCLSVIVFVGAIQTFQFVHFVTNQSWLLFSATVQRLSNVMEVATFKFRGYAEWEETVENAAVEERALFHHITSR